MKTVMTLISLLILLTLASCGQKASNATLKVTSGFAFNANNFDGGLIVSGVNLTTGQRFSSASSTTTTINLTLPNGNWEFYAMGWPTAYMSGTAKCGSATATLEGYSANVNIVINTANCATSTFGPNTAFTFLGCGAFYTDSTFANPITDGSPVSFCSSLPKDLQGKTPNAYKIVAFNSPLGAVDGTDSFASGCQNMGPANWPRLNIPLAVVFYEDSTTCLKEINRYVFPAGLANGNSSQFDSKFFITSSSHYLALPTNELRRGYSPFMNILPTITCSGGECLDRPSSLPSDHFVTWNNIGFGTEILVADNANPSSCSGFSSSPTGSYAINGIGYEASTCRQDDKRVYVRVGHNSSSSCPGPCSETLSFSSTNLGTIAKTFWTQNSTVSTNTMETFNATWEAVGLRNQNTMTRSFFNVFEHNDDDYYYGELQKVRQMLGPDGAGGVLSTISLSCTGLANGSARQVSIKDHEDNTTQTYKVEVFDIVTAMNNFVCNTSIGGACSGASPFKETTKEIRISNLTKGIYSHRIRVNCSQKIGVMHTRDDKGGSKIGGETIHWNTDSATAGRFESLSFDYEALNQYYAKATRFSQTAANIYNFRTVRYSAQYYSGSWDQRLENLEVKRETTAIALISRLKESDSVTSPTFGSLLGSSSYKNNIHFASTTPSNTECFKIGTSTTQLQNSFTGITGYGDGASSGITDDCTAYPNRSTDVSGFVGMTYQPANLAYSSFKSLFPLVP